MNNYLKQPLFSSNKIELSLIYCLIDKKFHELLIKYSGLIN